MLNLQKEGEKNNKEDQGPQFYGWECLSLKLTNRTFDIVIKDGLDRRHIVQGLELAMQIHNIRWSTEFVSGKLSLYIGAFSKY